MDETLLLAVVASSTAYLRFASPASTAADFPTRSGSSRGVAVVHVPTCI